MEFNISSGGVRLNIKPSGNSSPSFLSGVRQSNGRIEADLSNFTGTIVLSENDVRDYAKNVVLQSQDDKINEFVSTKEAIVANNQEGCGFVGGGAVVAREDRLPVGDSHASCSSTSIEEERSAAAVTMSILRKQAPSTNIASSIDNSEKSSSVVSVDGILEFTQQVGVDSGQYKVQDPHYVADHLFSNGTNINADVESTHELHHLVFHEACASEEINIEDLRIMLRRNLEAAAIRDKFGNYPAHIFGNNDAVIYCDSSDEEVLEFLFELYCAYPGAFFCEGSCGQIPFAGAIVDWIDECHQLYQRDDESVYRVSELKTLSKSDKVVNSLCVRAEVQLLTRLPGRVVLTPKVSHSFKMLSLLLEKLSDAAFESVSQRREFFSTSWKRRNKIVRTVASLPFLIRTILLIECPLERDKLLKSTVVKSAAFCRESVGLWIVSLLAGCPRSRNCAMSYFQIISNSCIADLYGKDTSWSRDDIKRFHDSRKELYSAVCKLGGVLPIMLRLGDRLREVACLRPAKYIVESVLGNAVFVYEQFSELICLLMLVLTYRVIIELRHNSPGGDYHEFFGLATCIGVFFALNDLGIIFGFMSFDFRLLKRHMSHISTRVEWLTTISLLTTLGMMYSDESIDGHSYYGIVAGLLWWKLLMQLKSMSSSLSTLVYTILQIAGSLKYFMLVFVILIFCFSDMIQIVTKTSGQCGGEPDFETMCSLAPVESYVAMYGLMIGGIEISAIGEFSPLVIALFIVATFSGMIVMVNILIAIVTSEYERACEESQVHFARARLEQAARLVAGIRFVVPAWTLNVTDRRILTWSMMWQLMYFTLFLCQEVFIIRSLVSSNALRKQGFLDHYFFIALVLCALLHHILFVGFGMSLSWMAVDQFKHLSWLKGGSFHNFLKQALLPARGYLKSIGLYNSESEESEDDENERPLKRKDFMEKEEELERKIKYAIMESEQRMQSFMSVLSN